MRRRRRRRQRCAQTLQAWTQRPGGRSRGVTTFSNMQFIDMDAPPLLPASHIGQGPSMAGERKKKKYPVPCLVQHWHFVPCVCSVDGIMGSKAQALNQRIVQQLS